MISHITRLEGQHSNVDPDVMTSVMTRQL